MGGDLRLLAPTKRSTPRPAAPGQEPIESGGEGKGSQDNGEKQEPVAIVADMPQLVAREEEEENPGHAGQTESHPATPSPEEGPH